ncbi:MAG: DUF1636 family protein [Acetobacteraceae bacterium]|nr:DUF1636 family protein [Acetobacteraceae bacterium]
MSGRVFVCLTCNRYAPPPAGEPTPGQRLAAATKAAAAKSASPVAVRTVECLNGCPHPCMAALRAPGKCVIRFAELGADDAPALIEAAELYATSADGDIPPAALPASLRAKVSGRVGARLA